MNIYPAIDLKSGQCVRLYQGRYDQVTLYHSDPIRVAKSFVQQGAKFLHVIDLDGAKQGESINLNVLEKLAGLTNLHFQTGGGIRSRQQISNLFNKGISRILLGSIAILDPKQVKEWLDEFGCERIVLALDVLISKDQSPKLALHGWQTLSEKSLWQILDEYKNSSLRHVLCTDISRDGTMQGPNIALYRECIERYPFILFQASGGVSTLNDLRELASLPISTVVVGKALYENKFLLSDALNEVNQC